VVIKALRPALLMTCKVYVAVCRDTAAFHAVFMRKGGHFVSKREKSATKVAGVSVEVLTLANSEDCC